ncbi:MAG TPA: helix-turn-helix transcriptional regulator [Pseudolabrys sp.]|jgi:DNA-binding CsgD family transcriptional regulator|nr:helix-turn-helix transcriptional regulator [Pseudolabrys sp.]
MGDIDNPVQAHSSPSKEQTGHQPLALESPTIETAAPAGPSRKIRQLDAYELEALRLFASGRSTDEMAAALGVSKSMAQHYLRIASRKLRARNRVHAVALAVRMGLVKPTRPNA